MTDLKAANEQLAKALKALESPEHDADVREAEACRNRLMELDERIGARIKAKLEAHKAIADAWGEEPQRFAGSAFAPATRTATFSPGTPHPPAEEDSNFTRFKGGHVLWGSTTVDPPITDGLTADAWQAHHEEHTGKYALAGEQVPDRVMVNGVAEMQQGEREEV